MLNTAYPRPSLSLGRRPLPSTPNALGTELAALLRTIGVPAVVTDCAGRVIAATPEAAHDLAWRGGTLGEGVEVRLCGQTFKLVMTRGATRIESLDLTPRQRVVIELVAEGLRNQEIADRLGISLHTVRRHVEALLKRLGVHTRAAAAVLLKEAQRYAQQGVAAPSRAA
jgi:DNA-binding NarL/FixJ family response regulator